MSATRLVSFFALIFAGEMVFSLPFHITRFFRPTFLEAFSLSNTNLGDIFALYGIVAMLAYFPSGLIADRFSARKLLAMSLFATALGGIYLAQIPSVFGLRCLFAYWGLTSILLFWSALIKATRDWGGDTTQGRAFGFLDAGRGLMAAGAASLAVLFFEYGLVDQALNDSLALQDVIYFYTGMTFLAGVLIWLFLPESPTDNTSSSLATHITTVISKKVVWAKAMVVLCAYCGFKGIDNFGLYLTTVMQMSELESAQFISQLAYLRPIGAVAAGILADRLLASRVSVLLFLVATLSCFVLSMLSPMSKNWLIYANILLVAAVTFGVRGIYFALVEETKTNKQVTGMTVGLVSVIGFFPDVFFAPLTGRILDQNPGLLGFQHYFLLLAGFAAFGLLAATYLLQYRKSILNNE